MHFAAERQLYKNISQIFTSSFQYENNYIVAFNVLTGELGQLVIAAAAAKKMLKFGGEFKHPGKSSFKN